MKKFLLVLVATATCAALFFAYDAVGPKAAEALASIHEQAAPIVVDAKERVQERLSFPMRFRPHAKQAVFMIKPYTMARQFSQSGGTGFLVESAVAGRVIVTNKHICDMRTTDDFFILEQGEAVYAARLILVSEVADLCLLKAPPEVMRSRVPYRLAASGPVPSEEVAVFGHPLLRPLTVSQGAYVNESREPIGMDGVLSSAAQLINMARLDFMVLPGNSGSPVVNDRNEVVGVVFAMEGGSRNGLVVPLDDLKRFLETFE